MKTERDFSPARSRRRAPVSMFIGLHLWFAIGLGRVFACVTIPEEGIDYEKVPYVVAGDEKFRSGDYAEALTLYRESLESDPESVAIYFRIARTGIEVGNYPLVLAAIDQLLERHPGLKESPDVEALTEKFRGVAVRGRMGPLNLADRFALEEVRDRTDVIRQGVAARKNPEGVARSIHDTSAALAVLMDGVGKEDLEAWKVAGELAVAARDPHRAVLACEALSRLTPEPDAEVTRLISALERFSAAGALKWMKREAGAASPFIAADEREDPVKKSTPELEPRIAGLTVEAEAGDRVAMILLSRTLRSRFRTIETQDGLLRAFSEAKQWLLKVGEEHRPAFINDYIRMLEQVDHGLEKRFGISPQHAHEITGLYRQWVAV
ncbi:MAG: tetratricopeptide repeat protein, partial [Verrucomicrobiota bacterium]